MTERAYRWTLRLGFSLAAAFAGCADGDPCEFAPDAATAVVTPIEMGERDAAGTYGAFADGGEADLVLGSQGAYMVVVEVRLAPQLTEEECLRFRLVPTIDGRPEPILRTHRSELDLHVQRREGEPARDRRGAPRVVELVERSRPHRRWADLPHRRQRRAAHPRARTPARSELSAARAG